MKTFKTIFVGSFLALSFLGKMFGQAVHDPASLPVYKANAPITIDGILSEADWGVAAPHLMFRLNGSPSGLSFTPTNNGIVVKPFYADTSVCYVKFLYYGTKLYVALKSNDKQVCKFDWEGDGMFMVLKNAANQNSEFKLYVINSTTFGAETGGAAPIPSAGYGGVGVVSGTIYDSSDVDNGYTAEGFIDLSTIGYASVPASIQVFINIFDPDNYSLGAPPWGPNGNYAKQWWGSEWGSEFRSLEFMPGTSQYDPPNIPVYSATSPIIVDGNLNESDWAVQVPYLKFRVNGTPSGMAYMPTNSGLVVKPPYTDTSTCYVKFIHYGTKLYVALQSDDRQVCKFDWEGDGMFMVVKNASNQNSELKLYVINSTTFGAETGGAAPIPSAGYGGVGIVNGTILDSSDVDNGYTAEGFIDLSTIGYGTLPSSLQLFINIFDPDYYRAGSPAGFGGYGNYAKQWWGSEWGSEWRYLNLLPSQVPVELTSFTASFTPIGIDLRWETSTETNNQGFEIQRSTDNKNFATVAFVRGKGTTTERQFYSYLDKTDLTGSIYYRLKQLDFGGNYHFSNVVEVTRVVSFELSQNYPNPFNPMTTITYSIPQNSFVTLKVYDILGSEVATLINGEVEAGIHKINFNAVGLNSGVYFYTIKAGNFSETKKLMLMK